jgi:hypothetical protein
MQRDIITQNQKSDFSSKILPIWWEEIKLWFGWNDMLSTIWKTGIQLAGLWFAFYITGNVEDFIGSLAVEVGKIIFVIACVFTILFITYIRASNKLYDSQKEKEKELTDSIIKLTNELNKEPIDVDLDVYEHAFYENEINTVNKMVCVVVQNNSDEDIRCYTALRFLIRINSDNSSDNLIGEAIRNGSLISWSGGGVDENQEVLIKAGQERIVNIAQGTEGRLVFKMQNLDFAQYQNGIYALDVEIGGHIGGKKMKKRTECFHIEYEKMHKTFAGGDEKPYSSTDVSVNSTSVVKGYHQYGPASYRKLEIKKRNCEKEKGESTPAT